MDVVTVTMVKGFDLVSWNCPEEEFSAVFQSEVQSAFSFFIKINLALSRVGCSFSRSLHIFIFEFLQCLTNWRFCQNAGRCCNGGGEGFVAKNHRSVLSYAHKSVILFGAISFKPPQHCP